MVLSKPEMVGVYRKRAKRYNPALWLYRLAGFRSNRYRSLAVEALSLNPGDTVIDIGCGTGLNFPLLERAVQRQGSIIGVDLTDAMLKEARERAKAAGWHNVELVQESTSTMRSSGKAPRRFDLAGAWPFLNLKNLKSGLAG